MTRPEKNASRLGQNGLPPGLPFRWKITTIATTTTTILTPYRTVTIATTVVTTVTASIATTITVPNT